MATHNPNPWGPSSNYDPVSDRYQGSPPPPAPPIDGRVNDPRFQNSDQESRRPQHHSYDPNDGRPIPPGYVPPHREPTGNDSQYNPNYFPPPPREDYDNGQNYNDYDDHNGNLGRSKSKGETHNYDYVQAQQSRGAQGDRDYPDYHTGYQHPAYDRQSSVAGQGYQRHKDDYDYRRNDSIARPYAPSEPAGHDGNQLAPYDDEKADAEGRRGYEEYQQQQRGGYDDRYDDRRSDYRYDDRYDDRGRDRYDSRERYDSRDRHEDRRYDDRDRDRHSRRRPDSRYEKPSSPTAMKNKTGPDVFGGKEGDRGLGPSILGGAAGGLIGHEFGGGLVETIGGVIVGALGAKVVENQTDKYKSRKDRGLPGIPFMDQAMRGGNKSSSSKGHNDDRRRDDRSRRRGSRGESRRSARSGSADYYSDDYSRSPPRRSNSERRPSSVRR